MVKRHTRHRRQKRQRRRTMKGGAFTQQELQQLKNSGFSEYQIENLTDLEVSFNEVMQKVDTIMNEGPNDFHGNSDDLTERVVDELLIEHGDAIPHADDDSHNLDISQDSLHLSDLDISQASQGPLHLSDLDTSQASQGSLHLSDLDNSRMTGYTTSESHDEFGGRRRKRTTKKRRGKKTKKTRKQRGGKKSKKTRKQRGGVCFGNGVGANSYDPNYSIYNTNMLKFFPYRPS